MSWISVNDRLPEDGERIVSLGIPDGENYYTSLEHYYLEKVGLVHNIKLWMPIPEPPNNGDEDE